VRLEAGASSELHLLHVLTPLRLRLWIGAPSYDQAPMRGTISLERPLAGERKRTLSCELRRRPEAAGSSGSSGSSGGASGSSRAVTLSLALSATNSATCSLSFAAPHWLHNHSSLPLQLHDARAHGAVLESAPYARAAQLFSLANEHGTTRLGLLEPGAAAPASAAPHAPRVPPKEAAAEARQASPALLSPPFSVEAVGNYSSIELRGADGSVAEVAMHVGRSSGPLRSAAATVLTLHDRFVLRNRAGIELEWAQVSCP
jgi:hypothetical protein